jgi:hypothetical protein
MEKMSIHYECSEIASTPKQTRHILSKTTLYGLFLVLIKQTKRVGINQPFVHLDFVNLASL